MYQGIGHFQKMLNGYSGHAPASFYQMRDMMASFPDDRSMAFLRSLQVDYVVVRAGLYEEQTSGPPCSSRWARWRICRSKRCGRTDRWAPEAIYRIKREPNQK